MPPVGLRVRELRRLVAEVYRLPLGPAETRITELLAALTASVVDVGLASSRLASPYLPTTWLAAGIGTSTLAGGLLLAAALFLALAVFASGWIGEPRNGPVRARTRRPVAVRPTLGAVARERRVRWLVGQSARPRSDGSGWRTVCALGAGAKKEMGPAVGIRDSVIRNAASSQERRTRQSRRSMCS